MRTNTVKKKITRWYSALFLILILAVLLLLYFTGQSTIRTTTKEKLKALVDADCLELKYLKDESEMESGEGDHYYTAFGDGYLEIDDNFRSHMDGMNVVVYAGEKPIYGENPDNISLDGLPFEDGSLRRTTQKNGRYFVYDTKTREEALDGIWIRGIVSVQEGKFVLNRTIGVLLFALPALAIVAVSGGYLITYRSLQPLEDICSQAERINKGTDLGRRIEIRNESTETRRLADTFNRMFERLYDSFEREKQFTSDASHELRTPIAVIMAECEYALEEDDAAEWREALEVISRQGKKMSDFVEELLIFTRMERGVLQLQKKRVDLSGIARDVCEEQRTIQQTSIQMHIDAPKEILVEADEKLLARMIQNLVVNAYKYGKDGGNVWVSCGYEKNRAVLSVKDDGVGIRAEELPHIWNRFYRADNARSDATSAGLGLSMVKQIAELHHAEVAVSSEIDKGSEFLIFF